jgi:16S rRNA A1518/A1519 N6-dimethyltransferase RsmA/KsgA/DIM1 with predicted DNA glycosylase/AP lyase activity
MSLQQHFLVDTKALEALLERLRLDGRTVVDFGLGRGRIAELALDAGAVRVIGFEIDPSVVPADLDARIGVVIDDFTSAQAEGLVPLGATVVAAPPYDQLPFLYELFKRRQVVDIILMVPSVFGSAAPEGFKLWGVLDGTAFDPPAKGQHLIVYQGFE